MMLNSIQGLTFLEDPIKLAKEFDALDKYTLGQNSLFGWLKSLVMPDKSN